MVTVDNGVAEFSFFRPNTAAVFLAGDFNDWRKDQLRMSRRPDGYWHLRLKLPAGAYKFRYLADGAWYSDYAAFGLDVGPFGLDSVVLVEPARQAVAAAPAAESPQLAVAA